MGMHPHIPNDGEWDMIGGSDATSETDDETAKKESSKRDGNDFASGESERHSC